MYPSLFRYVCILNNISIIPWTKSWLHFFGGGLEGWALVNRFNHTSLVTAVTPTHRPKSIRNRCVIEVFGDVFMLSRCILFFFFFFFFAVGVGAFVLGLSQISSFLS